MFIDDYLNSVNLVKKLINQPVHLIGTLRSNRKDFLVYDSKAKLFRGQHIWCRQRNVYVSKLRSITAAHYSLLIKTQNRCNIVRAKLLAVSEHNKHMSGIDKSDLMSSY